MGTFSLEASRLIVDRDAYAANLAAARRRANGAKLIAVVKADAYGLGALALAPIALAAGAEMLAVAQVVEGIRLREAGIDAPILVMIEPLPAAMDALVAHRLTPMLSSTAAAEALSEAAQRANREIPVHCKIDTGMGRQGFALGNAARDIQQVSRLSRLDIEGIATHFARADVPEDAFTYEQLRQFRHVLRELERLGVPFEMVHAANGAAVLNYPDAIFDAVRCGLMSFGVWPCQCPPQAGVLRPVVRWETHIAALRDYPAGAPVGYGGAYTPPHPMRAAILPVGYADGFPVALSNNAEVLVRGRRCPVRGRVSMDQMLVDLGPDTVSRVGDPAVLAGTDGAECIAVEELAQRAGTIPYEILTGIGPRVRREYV